MHWRGICGWPWECGASYIAATAAANDACESTPEAPGSLGPSSYRQNEDKGGTKAYLSSAGARRQEESWWRTEPGIGCS